MRDRRELGLTLSEMCVRKIVLKY